MHNYFLKTPWWVRRLYPSYLWRLPAGNRCVYLTFDDGPHPTITPWVLDQLKQHNATATFFCIGKNVTQHPDVYCRIIEAGHTIGNHTFSHLNGWKTPDRDYLSDIEKAAACIDSKFFRPPYGRIKKSQADRLPIALKRNDVKVVMWDVLSADFDASVSPERCAAIVLKRVEAGSVVVFHDSEKAFPRLKIALPKVLHALSARGFHFAKI